MSNKCTHQSDSVRPTIYQIRIKGHLDNQWKDWFNGMTITQEADGNTLLTGTVIDQAALHGLLKKVRDLGMPLVSVSQVQFNETHPYCSKKGVKNEHKHKDRQNGYENFLLRHKPTACGKGTSYIFYHYFHDHVRTWGAWYGISKPY